MNRSEVVAHLKEERGRVELEAKRKLAAIDSALFAFGNQHVNDQGVALLDPKRQRVRVRRYPRVCEGCGRNFKAKTSVTRFCDTLCYGKTLREKQRKVLGDNVTTLVEGAQK